MYAYQYPRPRRKRKNRHPSIPGEGIYSDEYEYEYEHRRFSGGHGTLEFTPEKAGLDITPANHDFIGREEKKPSVRHSISGKIEFV